MDISKDLETLSAKAQVFLRTAEQTMSIGDYGVSVSVAQDEAEHLLEAAKDSVRKVKEYLDKWAQQK